MEQRRHRVDLRDFLQREVPLSRLSPDLRQRVRHVLAGHGDLFSTTAEVVRELLSTGELRRAGTVQDGPERVSVYGLARSTRVFDLRELMAPPEPNGRPTVDPGAEEVAPLPVISEPVAPPSVREATVETPVFADGALALRALRKVFERDWVSFGIESALDALLEQIQEALGVPCDLVLWAQDGMPTAAAGQHWRRVDESDPDTHRLILRLRDHPSVPPAAAGEARWWRVHLLTGVVGALGITAQVDAVAAEQAAHAISSLLMAVLRSQTRVYQDPLTGLHNRAFFETQMSMELERAIRLGQPLALLFVDLDFFKKINDGYGHDVGDLLLEHVARTIAGHLRRIDQVFRWGGEEFVVLLPGTGRDEGFHAAERLRTVVERSPLTLPDGRTIEATVSVGVALAPEHAMGGERAFLRHADQALYSAKESGRNQTCVYND